MPPFKNLRRETLADSVYGQIRAAIVGGDIPDGAELNQVELAHQFNVSRVPVREALRRLQAERLVSATPYQQYIVSGTKADDLLELIAIREELEVFAVRRHLVSLTPELIQQMRAKNSELREQENKELWLAGDMELHELMDGSDTEASRMVLDLRHRVHRYLRTVASTRERRRQACVEHDRIIDAMNEGDAAAAESAVREHIKHTYGMIESYLRKKQLSPPTVAVARRRRRRAPNLRADQETASESAL